MAIQLNKSAAEIDIDLLEGLDNKPKVNEVWDDLKAPLQGQRLDTTSGRLDYDYFNGAVNFNANARYPDEPITILMQMPHGKKEGSNLRPHLHWLQESNATPNFLLAYKWIEINTVTTKETDFSNYTLLPINGAEFPYQANLHQINIFDEIAGTIGTSDCIAFALFRDSTNVSGLFAGADSYVGDVLAYEFDCHYQIDQLGSIQEFEKE